MLLIAHLAAGYVQEKAIDMFVGDIGSLAE